MSVAVIVTEAGNVRASARVTTTCACGDLQQVAGRHRPHLFRHQACELLEIHRHQMTVVKFRQGTREGTVHFGHGEQLLFLLTRAAYLTA